MKGILILAAFLAQFTVNAQYQTQKGRWNISHVVAGYGYSTFNLEEYDEGSLDAKSSWTESVFRLGFSGPDWGEIESRRSKYRDEMSSFESDTKFTAIWLQPQAGYFVR